MIFGSTASIRAIPQTARVNVIRLPPYLANALRSVVHQILHMRDRRLEGNAMQGPRFRRPVCPAVDSDPSNLPLLIPSSSEDANKAQPILSARRPTSVRYLLSSRARIASHYPQKSSRPVCGRLSDFLIRFLMADGALGLEGGLMDKESQSVAGIRIWYTCAPVGCRGSRLEDPRSDRWGSAWTTAEAKVVRSFTCTSLRPLSRKLGLS